MTAWDTKYKNVSVMDASTVGKGPLPVKLYPAEDQFLRAAHGVTGVSMVELARRGIRLMERQQRLFNSYAFILELKREQDQKG